MNKEDLDLVILNRTKGELLRFCQKGLKTIMQEAKWEKDDNIKIITYHEFETNRTKIEKLICKKNPNLKASTKKKSCKGLSKTPKKTISLTN